MAVCGSCGRNMETTVSCNEVAMTMIDGMEYNPVPFGQGEQADLPSASPTLSAANIARLQSRGFGDLVQRMEQGNIRCHDCGVEVGGLHHLHCDMEECPRCHEQLYSCACLAGGR